MACLRVVGSAAVIGSAWMAVASAAVASPAPRLSTSVYGDPDTENTGTAPNVAQVAVQSLSGNRLEFKVVFTRRPANPADRYFIEIDSDNNPNTGADWISGDARKNGIDHSVFYTNKRLYFRRDVSANGTSKSLVENNLGRRVTWSIDAATGEWDVAIAKALLGNPRSFTFYVAVDAGGKAGDYAPNLGSGSYSYPEAATPNGTLDGSLTSFAASPSHQKLVAGQTEHIVVSAKRSNAAAPTRGGTFLCEAFLPSGLVSLSKTVQVKRAGTLDCPIKVPRSAKGQTISVAFLIFWNDGWSSVWTNYLTAH